MQVRIDASQLIKGLDKIAKAIPAADQRAGKAEADLSVANAKETVHVVTGRLKNSIRVFENKPYLTRWGSDLFYAGAEEFRGGEHSYIMPEVHRAENGALVARIVEELRRSA